MTNLSFRMTITTYYRGFRINSAWGEPNCYPEKWVSFIIGWISFLLVIRDNCPNTEVRL